MKKIIITLLLLLLASVGYSQKIYFTDTLNGKTILREVSSIYPLPVNLVGFYNYSHTWTGTQYFNKLFVDTLFAHKIDSIESAYWYNADGDTVAYIDVLREKIAFFSTLQFGSAEGNTIVASDSIYTSLLSTDSIRSGSPLNLFSDSIFLGKSSKIAFKEGTGLYPLTDYGANLGTYDQRFDSMYAKNIKISTALTSNTSSEWWRPSAYTFQSQYINTFQLTNPYDGNGIRIYSPYLRPSSDYGSSLGSYNYRWDTVNAKIGKIRSVYTDTVKIGSTLNMYNGYIIMGSTNLSFVGTNINGGNTGQINQIYSTTPQSYLMYDKYVNNSNYRRLNIGWTADSTAVIKVENAGQYTARPLQINGTVYKSSVSTISDSTINCNLSNNFTKTLSANQRFVFSNFDTGQTVNISITNTADNYTVTWVNPDGLTIKWAGNITPVQTIGVKTDVYSFIRIGDIIYGTTIQNF